MAADVVGYSRMMGADETGTLEALPDLEHALRLAPLMGHQYRHFIGSAYLIAGQYGEAAEAFRERIRQTPKTDLSRGLLIAALGHLGEIAEARHVWAALKEINPEYSFTEHIERLPFTNPADVERIKDGFAKAGLPEDDARKRKKWVREHLFLIFESKSRAQRRSVPIFPSCIPA